MGALHAGHASLLRRAADECDVVALTLFVNPTQFAEAADLTNYPRTLDADLAVAREAGCDLVFAPSVEEMYPDWPRPPATTVTVRSLVDRWEGASRPGHFDGVATVVTKFLSAAGRCRTYFGEKDFQQLAVVRRMVRDLSLPAEVVGCAIVREPDGLALSSRNARLSTSERAGRRQSLAGPDRRSGRPRHRGRHSGRRGDHGRGGGRGTAGGPRLRRRRRRRRPRAGGRQLGEAAASARRRPGRPGPPHRQPRSPVHAVSTAHLPPGTLDVLVLGSGVAGLSAAVRLAAPLRAAGGDDDGRGLRVGVLTKAELSQSATRWAQGGVAAVLGGDEDSTDLHLADTLAAGVGLCDADAVRVLVDEGPARVHQLIAMGAVFDRQPGGALALAREGGHSTARVVHAGGAATGAEVERALVDATRASAAAVLEEWFALDLVVEDGRCRGVVALDTAGRRVEVRATHTVLATGGAGQVFAVTTNPAEATGDGLAMALRAGVPVADVEFMQFHPTALHHPAMPRPLLSEALRGHGALLRDAGVTGSWTSWPPVTW